MASEFFFNIQQSKVWEALLFDQIFQIKKVRIVRKALLWVFRILCAVFIVGFFAKTLSEETLALVLVGIFLSFAAIATLFLIESFGGYLKAKHPGQTTKNLADALSFESAQALKNASSLARVLLLL